MVPDHTQAAYPLGPREQHVRRRGLPGQQRLGITEHPRKDDQRDHPRGSGPAIQPASQNEGQGQDRGGQA